jgi:SAM-dependent methyltransferase
MNREVLLIGAGSSTALTVPTPLMHIPPTLTTLDIELSHEPDVLWDLNQFPWPFEDSSFDEVHGYEVLEHLGHQGNAAEFFGCFWEIYRILKPLGFLAGSVPDWNTMWAWGDPSHTRVINHGSLTYLDRTAYAGEIGKTTKTDFRSVWKGDFEAAALEYKSGRFWFLLKAHKPARA